MYKIKYANKPKKPDLLVFKEYSDDWKGCNELINVLIDYHLKCRNYANNVMKNPQKFTSLMQLEMNDATKINPAFFPLIRNYVFLSDINTVWKGKFQTFNEIINHKKPSIKMKDDIIEGKNWINVNSIYPNYENKGTICIDWFDTEEKIQTYDNKVIEIEKNTVHEWSPEIANILNVMDKFNGNYLKILPHQKIAIKFIACEVLANTFQHAFKTKGVSSIGIFINKETRDVFMTISDRGISIPESVRKFNKKYKNKNDTWTIDWALKEGTTTKGHMLQGGIGLYRTKKIIESSDGEFALRSFDGIYHSKNGIIKKTRNHYRNQGTIFYCKFNLDKIRNSDVKISDEIWEEVKRVFE